MVCWHTCFRSSFTLSINSRRIIFFLNTCTCTCNKKILHWTLVTSADRLIADTHTHTHTQATQLARHKDRENREHHRRVYYTGETYSSFPLPFWHESGRRHYRHTINLFVCVCVCVTFTFACLLLHCPFVYVIFFDLLFFLLLFI